MLGKVRQLVFQLVINDYYLSFDHCTDSDFPFWYLQNFLTSKLLVIRQKLQGKTRTALMCRRKL